MIAVLEALSRERYVLAVKGPLRVPRTGELTDKVRTLVGGGKRRVVLDLAGVSSIDASGIGELMRLYRGLKAVRGSLEIVRARRRVRVPLQRAGVFDLLHGRAA